MILGLGLDCWDRGRDRCREARIWGVASRSGGGWNVQSTRLTKREIVITGMVASTANSESVLGPSISLINSALDSLLVRRASICSANGGMPSALSLAFGSRLNMVAWFCGVGARRGLLAKVQAACTVESVTCTFASLQRNTGTAAVNYAEVEREAATMP